MILKYRGYTLEYYGSEKSVLIKIGGRTCDGRPKDAMDIVAVLLECRKLIDEWIAEEQQAKRLWKALETIDEAPVVEGIDETSPLLG